MIGSLLAVIITIGSLLGFAIFISLLSSLAMVHHRPGP